MEEFVYKLTEKISSWWDERDTDDEKAVLDMRIGLYRHHVKNTLKDLETKDGSLEELESFYDKKAKGVLKKYLEKKLDQPGVEVSINEDEVDWDSIAQENDYVDYEDCKQKLANDQHDNNYYNRIHLTLELEISHECLGGTLTAEHKESGYKAVGYTGTLIPLVNTGSHEEILKAVLNQISPNLELIGAK